MKRALKALTGFVVFLAASCGASGHWENPNVALEQWPKDQAACKRKAYAEMKKEIAHDPAYRDFGMTRGNTLQTNMARYRAIKSQESLLASCMKRRGYRKAGKKGWF